MTSSMIEYTDQQASCTSFRELTQDELMLVSGGDDPGDSSSDGAGDSGTDGGSVSVGTSTTPGELGTVTVTADAPADPSGGIGDQQAQQLARGIEFAFTDPAAAIFAFLTEIQHAPSLGFPAAPGQDVMGNPTGINPPDPAGP